MNSIFLFLLFIWRGAFTGGYSISSIKDNDIVSVEMCRKLCRNGMVFNAYVPPKEPECSSFISCRKCDYTMMVKKSDPSVVCSYVFSNDFSKNELESQITLYHGKSQFMVPHNSTQSRLSNESNIKDKDKSKRKHGLFSIFVDWKKVNGVDASLCSNGIAEIEWSLFNTGVYRNWDIIAMLETRPEATFPFCYEDVEIPLDNTRSTRIGRNLPTNLKRLGYSVTQGRPTAIRLTKIIAVNQPEMKANPDKTLALLLEEYVSFKIGVNGISVKEVYSEAFHETRKENSTEYSSMYSNLDTITESYYSTDSHKSNKNSFKKDNEPNKKVHDFNEFMKNVVSKVRGKGYTDPLILDSLLSLGFYSCFRVICTKKRIRRIPNRVKLEPRIPLSLEIAREIHSNALAEHINHLPPRHTVPLPIYNSEYWVRGGDLHKERQNIDLQQLTKYTNQEKMPEKGTMNKVAHYTQLEDQKVQYTNSSEESELSSSFSDLLTLIALTNSELLDDKNTIKDVLESDTLLT